MANTKDKEKAESEFVRSDREFFDPTLNFQGQSVWRSGTPETMLTDYPLRPAPDISIQCEKCKNLISLIALKDHRLYHKSLTILKYGNTEEPKNADILLKRRNAVLRKIKSAATTDKPVRPEQIQDVNDAYEYLKSQIQGNFEELRQIREDVNAEVGGVALNGSSECVHAVGVAASQNERWKSYMEDARSIQDCFGEDKHKCFFGVYDGHHGRFAAEVAASELHKLLLSEMMKFDPRTKSVLGSHLTGEPDISHYRFERPTTMHSERVVLYDESVSIIQNIINVCESKYDELIKKINGDNKAETPRREGDTSLDTDRKKKKEKTPFELKMESAFCKAYYLLDILLSYGKDEHSKIRWSGSSAVTCVVQDLSPEEIESPSDEEKGTKEENEGKETGLSSGMEPPKTVGTIHLANAGNTHAILVRGNKAYGLTKDHTPSNKKERNRILKDGGNLSDSSKECLVNGVLLTTRGLGNHGDTSLKKCVLVEPYTTSVPVDQYAQFLVMATRGVWEVFSEKEAASLLLKLLPCNQIPPPRNISSTLQPLFEQLDRDHSTLEPNSRRVSFSSVETPFRAKSAELERVKSGRQRSATLQSVKEEGQNSSKVISKVQGQSNGEKDSSNDKSNQNSEDTELDSDKNVIGQRSNDDSQISEENSSRERTHSTPTGNSNKNSGKSNKKSKNLVDADMQTEIGSNYDYDDDDSGNEGDVDTYLENISFPGSVSRISMVDGPPSREQKQRNLAKQMAEHLVQAALLAGAKDNVTAMVVLLPCCGL